MKKIIYAITYKNSHIPVSVALSVLGAWHMAERCLGDKVKDLRKMGYTLEEGTYRIKVKTKRHLKKVDRNICPECAGEGERCYQGEAAPGICRRCGGSGKKKWKNKPNVCPKGGKHKKVMFTPDMDICSKCWQQFPGV